MANQWAIQDDNQFPALIAHTGVAGTAETVRVVADTDGNLMVNLAAGEEINIGTVILGTITAIGSIGTVSGMGRVGTIPGIGTIAGMGTIGGLGTVSGIGVVGTVTGMGTVGGIGTIAGIGGTVNTTMTMGNIPGGTLGLVSSVASLTTGTIANVGTIPGVGVVGTVTGMGTLAGLGTCSGVGVIGTVTGAGVVGTVTGVGVVASLTAGTVNLSPKSPTQILTVSELGTAGGSAFGTLSVASGAGTNHYVTGLQVVVCSGTVDTYLGFGTALTGGSVLARGSFPPGGGIVRDFTFPIQSGTNSEICYELAGAGTVFYGVNYWKGA